MAAGVWAVAGSLWLFPLLTDNADEGAYLSQSAALRAGQLLPEAPAHPGAYHPWFSAMRDGHYVFKYTPVHAATLAASKVLFGSERVALGFIAAAVIVLLALVARELGASPGASALGCVVFALSPVWIIQSATFLPYCGALVWMFGFLLFFLRGTRLRSVPQLVLAGGFAGIALFARPFEAVLFVGIAVLWRLYTTRGAGVVRPLAWCALGAIPGVVLLLAYNAVATGSPFRLAFQVTGADDTLGFGVRRVLVTDPGVHYTVGKAFSALANNMELVMTWMFGGILGVVLAAVGFSRSRDLRGRGLLSMILVGWPLGFFFFWGAYASALLWEITRYVGPFYYLPMLMTLAVAAGVGIARVASHRAWLGGVTLVALAGVTLFTLVPSVRTNEERTAQREVIADAVHSRLDDAPRSVLFLPGLYGEYLQNPFSFLRNQPGYDDHILYAVQGSNREFAVLRDHPGRDAYVLSIPSGYSPEIPAAALRTRIDPVSSITGAGLAFRVQVSSTLFRKHPVVRMVVGNQLVYVRLVATPDGGGATRFTIARTARGIAVTSPDDSTAHASSRRVPQPLQVSLVIPEGAYKVVQVVNRSIPLRTRGAVMQALWPGSETTSVLAGPDTWTLTATPTDAQSVNE